MISLMRQDPKVIHRKIILTASQKVDQALTCEVSSVSRLNETRLICLSVSRLFIDVRQMRQGFSGVGVSRAKDHEK
jgi:hypothetical protein